MITIATLFWKPNANSQNFSSMYDESWVIKLYNGFKRNLKQPFSFVCYVDEPKPRLPVCINQMLLSDKVPTYQSCVQPYELSTDGPMIICGLDTVITGNIDHLVDWVSFGPYLALPRDPYNKAQACNGVALVPAGYYWLWSEWDRRGNDMDRCRSVEHWFIDDLFPGQVVSYKGHVKERGLGDARIVFFHGQEKPHQMGDVPWIQEHWR